MKERKIVIVKFRTGGDAKDRLETIKTLVGKDLASAAPLFPDGDSDELGSLYEVVLAGAASAELVISWLVRDSRVEYAHEPSRRRPV